MRKDKRCFQKVTLLREQVLFTENADLVKDIPDGVFLYETGGQCAPQYPDVIGKHQKLFRYEIDLPNDPNTLGSVVLGRKLGDPP